MEGSSGRPAPARNAGIRRDGPARAAACDELAGLIYMHDLVDDLEQRLAVVNLAVMHFLWLAPAAIKQRFGRGHARHRLHRRLPHYAGEHPDGSFGVRARERLDVSAVFWHFPLVMFCKHSLQSASALTNQSSRSRARARAFIGS